MHSGITGIHITSHHVTAVQITRGFGTIQVTGCAHIEINAQNPLENALETLSKALNLKGEECIVGLPDTHVFYRNLTLPFKDKKKQREVIPFELETGIAFPIEDAVMDFTPADHANAGEILVVFAQKPMIKELLDPFERLGIFPEVLTSTGFAMASRLLRQKGTPQTGLLMNMAEGRLTLVLWKNRRIVLIRNVTVPGFENDNPKDGFEDAEVLHLCHMAKNTIHAFAAEHRAFSSPEKAYLDGSLGAHIQTIHKVSECLKITAEKVDLLHDPRITLSSELDNTWDSRIMNGALSLALAGHGPNAGPNLRQGEFEIYRQSFFKSRHFRKITLWLLIIGLLWGVNVGVDIYFLKERKAILEQEIRNVFKSTFPQINRIVDPVKQAQIKIREMQKTAFSGKKQESPARALDLLREISRRVPASLNLKVTRLTMDPYAIRIKGSTDTYNTVDQIKQNLTDTRLFKNATISSANLDRDKKRVLFEIKLER